MNHLLQSHKGKEPMCLPLRLRGPLIDGPRGPSVNNSIFEAKRSSWDFRRIKIFACAQAPPALSVFCFLPPARPLGTAGPPTHRELNLAPPCARRFTVPPERAATAREQERERACESGTKNCSEINFHSRDSNTVTHPPQIKRKPCGRLKRICNAHARTHRNAYFNSYPEPAARPGNLGRQRSGCAQRNRRLEGKDRAADRVASTSTCTCECDTRRRRKPAMGARITHKKGRMADDAIGIAHTMYGSTRFL